MKQCCDIAAVFAKLEIRNDEMVWVVPEWVGVMMEHVTVKELSV
jgi:hypothetical protein